MRRLISDSLLYSLIAISILHSTASTLRPQSVLLARADDADDGQQDDYRPLAPIRRKGPRCTSHDAECWPSAEEWNAFNASISGRLIRSLPSAAACHDPEYDTQQCSVVQDNWTSSDWRTAQVGAYSGILWEVGSTSDSADACLPETAISRPCDQGLVASYSVDARTISDIQKSVQWTRKHDLYLVVKNTGHDHLGRSSGDGSFAIWTHNMKGQSFEFCFVPEKAPKNVPGVPAVTLQAGEQWLDVYRGAAAHNVTVAGGSARTVGSSGGYVLGGGHSPFSFFYGLAADNLLEVSIVTPKGEHKILNAYTDPDYFWAVRGGGGSAWGVVTSVTYKTHPLPSHIQVVLFQANVSTTDAYRTVFVKALKGLPALTAAGYTGYGSTSLSLPSGEPGNVQFIFLQPNGTDEQLSQVLQPFLSLDDVPDAVAFVANFSLPDWISYTDLFLRDPNVGTNVQDASRLLTEAVINEQAEKLVDLVLKYPESGGAGFNFIGRPSPLQRAQTSVHPIWRDALAVFSLAIDWSDEGPDAATAVQKRDRKKRLVDISNDLSRIVGKEGGTYVNEANPYEPDWQRVFWGAANYARLLGVKKRIDPTGLFVCNRCVGSDVIYEP